MLEITIFRGTNHYKIAMYSDYLNVLDDVNILLNIVDVSHWV